MAGEAQAQAAAAAKLEAAHRALTADPDVQFQLQRVEPPRPPEWLLHFLHALGKALRPVGRFFRWVDSFLPDAPWAKIFLWAVIALAAATLLLILWRGLRHARWEWPYRRRRLATVAAAEDEEWRPEEAPARAWLEEADRLAGEGRYAEAIHHLLLRSVEDIARRRPRLVRPALTSRELAAAGAVPEAARGLFAGIAASVERSLFGGRAVGAADWDAARGAYADFVLPRAWKA
ncbi:MAG: DUF4129 domain-containing protein [Alphaproteobacteria bacterium]|nr:DUF4129 domain-containing protein [Alphaproteobacteria bacterium]